MHRQKRIAPVKLPNCRTRFAVRRPRHERHDRGRIMLRHDRRMIALDLDSERLERHHRNRDAMMVRRLMRAASGNTPCVRRAAADR
jgi:hypothetical protein